MFLNTLTDFELANFYYYKYDTFMEHTKSILDKYYLSKGMTSERIRELMIENEEKFSYDKENRCPRCLSRKKFSEIYPFDGYGYGYSGLFSRFSDSKKEIYSEKCVICDCTLRTRRI